MKLWTLDDMESNAIELLRVMEPPAGYYLAFSGGKDSIVLHEIAKRSGVKFDAHYNITNVDPPEVVKFIRENYPHVEFHRPEITMWRLIEKKLMPPTRIVRYCCDYLKERGGEGRIVLVGIRAIESTGRKKQGQIYVCGKTGKVLVKPIFSWLDNEVWEYIASRRLAYPKLYDEGFTRLGCVGCPMAGPKAQRHQFDRWPKIGMAYIRAFQRMADNRKAKGKDKDKDTQWETGEDVMRWWCGWTPPSGSGPSMSKAGSPSVVMAGWQVSQASRTAKPHSGVAKSSAIGKYRPMPRKVPMSKAGRKEAE